MRMQISALTCALSVLLSVANAEQATPDSSEATPHEQAAIELFTAPRPKHIDMESYPVGELDKEGWVELAFMVDTHGRPFEVTVIRSTGNEAFDKVAMSSIEHSSFEPGKLNGTPVESGYEMKYRFASPVSGLISDRNWYLHLFKRHFRAVVSEGHISEVRLRCDKRHVFFTFDSTLQYEVVNKYGNCSIELLGTPGTRFELIQF